MNKNEIITSLPKLSRSDLEAVHAMTGHLLGLAGPVQGCEAEGAVTLATLSFNACAATVGASMRHQNLPQSLANKLNKAMPALKAFLDEDFEGWDHNKLTQQAFLQYLMSLLSDMLTAYETKPSVRTMILNLDKLPRAFDEQFPNYRASRMGGMILKRFM